MHVGAGVTGEMEAALSLLKDQPILAAQAEEQRDSGLRQQAPAVPAAAQH